MSSKKFMGNDGDWVCSSGKCNNVNFARRTHCNRCGEEKSRKKIKDGGLIIGKQMAEKSHGLFSEDDWQCKMCGNVNWARRNECNVCHSPKFGKIEERTGYGGGFNERGTVEYREDKGSDDEEYDQFGRKKKSRCKSDEVQTKGIIHGKMKQDQKEEEEDEEDDDGDLDAYKLDSDDDDDDDEVDLSAYALIDSDSDQKQSSSKDASSKSGPASSDPKPPSSSSSSSSFTTSSKSSRSSSYSSGQSRSRSRSKDRRSRSRSSSRSRSRSRDRRRSHSGSKSSSRYRSSRSKSPSRSRSRSRSPLGRDYRKDRDRYSRYR